MKEEVKEQNQNGARPLLPAVAGIEGCVSRKLYVKGPSKYGRAVADELTFQVPGTFESMYAAERFLSQAGYSVGSTCAMAPRGILKGDFLIAKWKNLTKGEKYRLDGIVEGDMREGPVTVSIYYTTSGNGR